MIDSTAAAPGSSTRNTLTLSCLQALNDFLVFGCVAVASFSSGHVMARHGWHTLNLLVYPAIGLVLVSLLWL